MLPSEFCTHVTRMTRGERQTAAALATELAFSKGHATLLPERARRVLEEAVELHQATANSRAEAHRIVNHVYSREVGDVPQEIGGISVCLLMAAEAAGYNVDDLELAELERFLGLPQERFDASRERKEAAGISSATKQVCPAPKGEVDIDRVLVAAEALYRAAFWTPDRPVDDVALWEELRDACGFEKGKSPKRRTPPQVLDDVRADIASLIPKRPSTGRLPQNRPPVTDPALLQRLYQAAQQSDAQDFPHYPTPERIAEIRAENATKRSPIESLNEIARRQPPATVRTKRIIIRNSAKCLDCGDEIESRHRHDFVECKCGGIFVDGGKDYCRRGVRTGTQYADTSVVEEVPA